MYSNFDCITVTDNYYGRKMKQNVECYVRITITKGGSTLIEKSMKMLNQQINCFLLFW